MPEKKKKGQDVAAVAAKLVEDIKVTYDISVNERIRLPIIWERLTTGYRIQDLQSSKYEEALDIIKENYFVEETLHRGIAMNTDEEGKEEYMNHLLFWVKDTQSLVAVEEGTGKIVGILIGRVVDKTVRTQWRFKINNNDNVDEGVETINLGMMCPNILSDDIMPTVSRTTERQSTNQGQNKSSLINPTSKKTLNNQQEIMSKRGGKSSKTSKPKRNKKSLVAAESLTRSRTSGYSDVSSYVTKQSSSDFMPDYLPLGKLLQPMFCDEATIFINSKLQKIHKLQGSLIRKYDLLKIYDVPIFYKIYVLYVLKEHRNNGAGRALVQSIMDICRLYHCDILCGIFTSRTSQNIAYKQGFVVHEEIKLNSEEEEGEERDFHDIDEDNSTVALMSVRLKEPEPPPPPIPVSPPRRTHKG